MFEPRVVCFFCKWCTYAGADLAGTSRKQYPPNGVVVRVNCSGRIDPQHVLWAFREGADGVLVGGCHPGDCHYQDGNYKTMRRVSFLKRMLDDMGVDPGRLHLEWISAAEGDKLVHVMGDFVDDIKRLGPLELTIAGDGRGGATRVVPRGAKEPTKKKAAGPGSRRRAAKKKAAKPKRNAAKKKSAKPKKKVAKRKGANRTKKATKKNAARRGGTAAKPKKKAAGPGSRRRAAKKTTRKRAK